MDESKQAPFVHGGHEIRQTIQGTERAFQIERQRLDYHPDETALSQYHYRDTVIITRFMNHDSKGEITMSKPFETDNRRLEQFLFFHDIHFISFYKNQDGYTVWTYLLDEEGLRVLDEWRQIVARKNQEPKQENDGNHRRII